jgi:predicted amidohydrolase YtcJ
MCIFCGSKSHVLGKSVSQIPGTATAPLSRRSFVSNAAAFGGIYAGAKVLGPVDASAQGTPAAGRADFVIENAKVITLDPRNPLADAVAVRGDRIVAVGQRRDMANLVASGTQIIDAGKRTVIPGLNDSHTHFIRGGLTYSQEVRWDGVPSLAIALRMLKEQAARTPAPHWVQVVGGWTYHQFREKRLPTLAELNAATGDVPCFVMHMYDRAFVNRAGVRVLGWNKDTPDPFGGVLARDATGAPTGLAITTTSLVSLLGIFARIPKLAPDDQILSTRHMMRELNRLGVTSLIDAGGGGQNYPENYAATAKLAADKQLTVRIGYTLMAQRPGREIEDYQGWLQRAKLYEGDDYFRLIGAGEYTLWAAGDNTNFARDPVIQPPIMEEKLTEVIKFLVSNNWPFRMHASFDYTAKRILGVLEKVHAEMPIDKLRWGLEHAEGLSVGTLERIKKLGGSLGLQNRMSLDGEAYVSKWGLESSEDAPAFGRIKQLGIPYALGTDGNRAASHNPWTGVEWLVTGRTQGGFKHQHDRNVLSREEALRAYSAAGAWISGEEDKKGTLSVGKWADLAILAEDYMTVPANRISQMQSMLTMVGGKVVYATAGYEKLAPPALQVTPSWLPIGNFASFSRLSSVEDKDPTGFKHAHAMIEEAMPTIVGADGQRWTIGCGCGLL